MDEKRKLSDSELLADIATSARVTRAYMGCLLALAILGAVCALLASIP